MASSQRKTLRFAVGTPEEYRSAIWRLWVQGNDVYVAARALTGLIKLSLHHSGKWRLAWTDGAGIKAQGSSDRVEDRWHRPAEFRPGWTQGPAVIVPNSGTQNPLRRGSDEDNVPVIWSPIPRAGHKHHFTMLFASKQAPPTSWQTVMRPDDDLLGTLNLKSGDKVVLCRREIAMVEKESSYIYFMAADMKINYSDVVPEVYGASVFTVGTDDSGHPYLLEIPLGWENVRGPEGQGIDRLTVR